MRAVGVFFKERGKLSDETPFPRRNGDYAHDFESLPKHVQGGRKSLSVAIVDEFYRLQFDGDTCKESAQN